MARPPRPYRYMETIEPLSRWMEDSSDSSLGVRQKTRWESSTHWRYAVPNGVFDPLTYLFILDAIMNMNPDIELRAGILTDYLNVHQKSFSWDRVTVGRVLSGLCGAFEDVLGPKNGILESGRDHISLFYRLHHNAETAKIAYRLREELMGLAATEMSRREAGTAGLKLESPLIACASVTENLWVAPPGPLQWAI